MFEASNYDLVLQQSDSSYMGRSFFMLEYEPYPISVLEHSQSTDGLNK